MHRNKQGSQYYTLVGGRVNDSETLEEGLVREVKEETGMDVIRARCVFYEEHPAPYNDQYIYICEVGPHDPIALLDTSEEAMMNRIAIDTHTPLWVDLGSFARLPFRTPQLQAAILHALKKGFPNEPLKV